MFLWQRKYKHCIGALLSRSLTQSMEKLPNNYNLSTWCQGTDSNYFRLNLAKKFTVLASEINPLPVRQGSWGKNGYMYMYGWVPSLFTWNCHNIAIRWYPNKKQKVKKKETKQGYQKKKILPLSCFYMCVCVCVCVFKSYLWAKFMRLKFKTSKNDRTACDLDVWVRYSGWIELVSSPLGKDSECFGHGKSWYLMNEREG